MKSSSYLLQDYKQEHLTMINLDHVYISSTQSKHTPTIVCQNKCSQWIYIEITFYESCMKQDKGQCNNKLKCNFSEKIILIPLSIMICWQRPLSVEQVKPMIEEMSRQEYHEQLSYNGCGCHTLKKFIIIFLSSIIFRILVVQQNKY